MKIFATNLRDISKEHTLRYDYDYHWYKNEVDGACYTFSDLFDINTSPEVNPDDLHVDFLYCEIGNADKDGDVNPEQLNFDNRDLLTENYYKKIESGDIITVNDGDILLSKVRPNLRKFVRITPDLLGCYFTSAFISLRPKTLPAILYYALRTVFYKDLIAISRRGKGYPTLNINDLKLMKFDKNVIDKLQAKSEVLTREILAAEARIKDLKATIRPVSEIIDSVFAREFGFDYVTFERLKAKKCYDISSAAFSNNADLRFSAKFHRDAGAFVQSQLTAISDKKIKHFLAEPIALGASVSPNDFDENGEAYYVSMATIKSLEIELDETQLLSDAYYQANKNKSVKVGDIIIARSGVAIGKTALIKEDFIGIFADFTMRVRLKNYNNLFAYYYFRSTYFQYMIEIYKKGLQNQNIFPSTLQEFPMIDISPDEQKRIVGEIQVEVGNQTEIKDEIARLRMQIEGLLEQALVPS